MPRKSRKDSRESVPLRKPKHGRGMLRTGGTNKGAGRPTNDWRNRMEALRDRWLQAAEAERVLDDPKNVNWLGAGKFIHEAVSGRPAQSIDHTTKGDKLPGVIILPAETPDAE